jgi:predicted  nucleic acid-binding Zn-ribbon protein
MRDEIHSISQWVEDFKKRKEDFKKQQGPFDSDMCQKLLTEMNQMKDQISSIRDLLEKDAEHDLVASN